MHNKLTNPLCENVQVDTVFARRLNVFFKDEFNQSKCARSTVYQEKKMLHGRFKFYILEDLIFVCFVFLLLHKFIATVNKDRHFKHT